MSAQTKQKNQAMEMFIQCHSIYHFSELLLSSLENVPGDVINLFLLCQSCIYYTVKLKVTLLSYISFYVSEYHCCSTAVFVIVVCLLNNLNYCWNVQGNQ